MESPKGCGILPIGQRVNRIYTSGLRWNLGNAVEQTGCELDMATFVSTSNQVLDGSSVLIVTSEPVI